MTCFYWIDADGAQCFGEVEGPMPAYALGEVPRLPGPFERWEDGAFVYDAAAHADAIAGPEHKAIMHARKAAEALLIDMGFPSPRMLLVKEAELRGVTAAELAATVLDKIAPAETIELERQAASLPKRKG